MLSNLNTVGHCRSGLRTILSLVVNEEGGEKGGRMGRRRRKGRESLVFEGLGLLPGEEVTPKVT